MPMSVIMPPYSAKQFLAFLGIVVTSWLVGFYTGNYWKEDMCCVILERLTKPQSTVQSGNDNSLLEKVQNKNNNILLPGAKIMPLPSATLGEKTSTTIQNAPPSTAKQYAPPLSQKTDFPDLPGLKFRVTSEIVIDKTKTPAQAEADFYRYIRHIDVDCANRRRLGHRGDGGWDVCMVAPFNPGPNCLVYSFGINNDWSFDDAISNGYNCSVRAFDPSISLGHHVRGKKQLITFYHRGIGGSDGKKRSSRGVVWDLKTFASFKEELGDSERIVDYLKFDVEFAEWGVLRTMLKDGSLQRVKQMGFEIHTPELGGSSHATTVAQFADYYSILNGLENLGFRKWYAHSNPMGMYTSRRTRKRLSCCFELIYINANFIGAHT